MKIGENYEIHTDSNTTHPFSPLNYKQALPTVAIRSTTDSKDQR